MCPMNDARSRCFLRHLTLVLCGILAHSIMFPVCLSADPSSWALLNVRDTGYNQNLAAVSTSGPIYLTPSYANWTILTGMLCSAPLSTWRLGKEHLLPTL